MEKPMAIFGNDLLRPKMAILKRERGVFEVQSEIMATEQSLFTLGILEWKSYSEKSFKWHKLLNQNSS